MSKKPLVIYLDQNQWINLARSYYDRADGKSYKVIQEKITWAINENIAIFPLSATHVIETRKEINLPRRQRLAKVMTLFSKSWSIAPEELILKFELRANITKIFSDLPSLPPRVFDRGIPFAFGKELILHDKNGSRVKMPEELARKTSDYISSTNITELFLVGDDEAGNLAGIEGYKKAIMDVVKRAESFRMKAKPYDLEMRKRAYVADRVYELQSILEPILSEHGKTLEDFFNLGQDPLMEFFANTPSFNTETELIIGRDQHWDKKIHHNDPSDIAFLSIAIPYCDIVVTEKSLNNAVWIRNTKPLFLPTSQS